MAMWVNEVLQLSANIRFGRFSWPANKENRNSARCSHMRFVR